MRGGSIVPLRDALVGDLHGVVEVGLQLPDLPLHLLRVLLAPAPGVDGPARREGR